jgi:RNA polymerase-binding protein DksA
MPETTKRRTRKHEPFEKALIAQRDTLLSRANGRLGDVYVEREPDDEAALASDSVTKDFAVATLERERRMLEEIRAALARIKNGTYGVCDSCGEAIPDARLRALPWARVCVRCAEQAGRSSTLAAD